MLIDHRRNCEVLGGQIVSGNISRELSAVNLTRDTLPAQVILAGANADLDWVVEDYDIGGWFNPVTPTFVTVPPGVTRVRSFFGVNFTGAFGASDDVFCTPSINGVVFAGLHRAVYLPPSGVFNIWVTQSPVYDVAPGDELAVNVRAFGITPASLSVTGGRSTAFGVEAVTMEF